jgi:nucleotide-binding universal stress UspA family protein
VLNRILVALDGSPHEWRALKAAVELAQIGRGRLTVLAVAPRAAAWLGSAWGTPVDVGRLEDDVARTCQALLDEAVAEIPHSIPVVKRLAFGAAADEILAELHSGRHDALVMAHHRRGRIRARVVRVSPVPVITVGGAWGGRDAVMEPGPHGRPERRPPACSA